MMAKHWLLASSIALTISACQSPTKNRAELLTGHLDRTDPVSDLLYGHFYEHIYHSANGGLWGDLVWNRSFEEFTDRPDWKASAGVISQTALINDAKLIFGDREWTDYEFSLEARKDAGYEGFLVLVRAAGEDDFYWVNLGGWGNSQHAIEKETGNQRSVVTPFVKGSVAENSWIPIKLRVTGNRIEAWMNNQPVYNYSDTLNPILKGAVGIGSWGTAVSYRNLRVKDLAGKILFEGLPEAPRSMRFPRHWIPSVAGGVTVESAGALNGGFFLTGEASDQSVSVSQENVHLAAGDPLNGSVWVKGSAAAGISVQLFRGETQVSKQDIGNLTATWKEYPIRFGGMADEGDYRLTVAWTGSGHASVDQLSLLPESSTANDGFRTDLFNAVRDIRPTVIRWPGGCFAELYRWKDGIGPQHARRPFPVNIWDDRDVNSLGTDEFIRLCRKLGSQPLLVINSGFHEGAGTPEAWAPWIREACEWLEYCNGPADSEWGRVRAANGHPEPYAVKYWEIDNELWRSRVPDPHKYSQAVRLFAAAMRNVDPSITVIAHGGNGTDMEWNQVVLNECAADFDILSIHHYSDPDGFYTAALEQDTLYKRLAAAIAGSANPAIRVYVSEWNAQSTDWRTGLYAGNLLNIFEKNAESVTMGGPALFLRHVSANAWDNAFINFNASGWFPAPNYEVMKLWREHFAPERLDLIGMPDSLNAVATYDRRENRLVYKLVNNSRSAIPAVIRLPDGAGVTTAAAWLIAGSNLRDRNTMEDPGRIRPAAHPVKSGSRRLSVDIPPLSCLLIEVK